MAVRGSDPQWGPPLFVLRVNCLELTAVPGFGHQQLHHRCVAFLRGQVEGSLPVLVQKPWRRPVVKEHLGHRKIPAEAGVVQRRVSLAPVRGVLRVDLRTSAKQELGHVQAARAHGRSERRGSPVGHGFEVRAAVDERPHALHVAKKRGHVEVGLASSLQRAEVRTSLHQDVRDPVLACPHGEMQGGLSVGILRLHVGPAGEQKGHDAGMPVLARNEEVCPSLAAVPRALDVCRAVDQKRRHPGAVVPAREPQGGAATDILGIHGRAALEQ
eukprot:scaffold11_cov257-Pinguiococcus_pyrenoidosus.AAC.53